MFRLFGNAEETQFNENEQKLAHLAAQIEAKQHSVRMYQLEQQRLQSELLAEQNAVDQVNEQSESESEEEVEGDEKELGIGALLQDRRKEVEEKTRNLELLKQEVAAVKQELATVGDRSKEKADGLSVLHQRVKGVRSQVAFLKECEAWGGKLEVAVLGARDLTGPNPPRPPDTVAHVFLGTKRKLLGKTNTAAGSAQPTWKSAAFTTNVAFTDRKRLIVELSHKDALTPSSSLGAAVIPLAAFVEGMQSAGVEQWVDLVPTHEGQVVTGQVQLRAILRPVPFLEVTVVRATDLLPAGKGGSSNPFVRVWYGNKKNLLGNSEVERNTVNPRFRNSTFRTPFTSKKPADPDFVIVQVFDDELGQDDPLGVVTVELDRYADNVPSTTVHKLQFVKKRQKVSGELEIAIFKRTAEFVRSSIAKHAPDMQRLMSGLVSGKKLLDKPAVVQADPEPDHDAAKESDEEESESGSGSYSYEEEEDDEDEGSEKDEGNEAAEAGKGASVQPTLEDKQAEFLAKLGQAMGGTVAAPQGGKAVVTVERLWLAIEGRDRLEWDLTQPNAAQQMATTPFTLKERSVYRIGVQFKVEGGMVTGMKYTSQARKLGSMLGSLSVSEEKSMGSFVAKEASSTWEDKVGDETPSGFVALGKYENSIKFVDGTGAVIAEFKQVFEIKKDWD